MKILKILLAVLMLLDALCTGILAAEKNSARSSVLIDAASGDVIFEKNPHERLGPASTTKIMTALVALENLSPETEISVDPRAVGVEGSSAYLAAGVKYTLEELLYAMMLGSANDAAAAIAYAVGGSIPGFAELMNARAESLGLCDTHFENPHGLDGETHYTTAYELALIARAALGNETFLKIVSTKTMTVGEGDSRRTFRNHNRLLFEYEDVIGVKTGFTKRCGRTLVSAARRDCVTLICVTLGDGDDWRDHRNMLDAGFDLYECIKLCEAGEIHANAHVCGGEREAVSVSNRDGASVVLPKSHGEIEMTIELPEFIYAPVSEGESVGRAVFFADGREIAFADLTSDEDCPATEKKNFLQRILPWKK